MSTDVVVILTALNLEYDAVRQHLTDPRVHLHPAGTRFEVGRLRHGGRAALGLVGKGNHPAAVLAERAMAEFNPAAVLFCGVAGALWPGIRLGDVVVASQVYAYHGGTSHDDGLMARPRSWETAHGAAQIAQHLIRAGDWADPLPTGTRPAAHFGPIAAGEVVHDSATSAQARWVRQHYNDALAIEMEGAGVAQAGHLNRALPVVVVRGISDRADGTKAVSDGEAWQPRAAANAAAFTVALARGLIADTAADDARTGDDRTERPHMSLTNTNVATGNARVGVQAGQVFGGIILGSAPQPAPGLAAEVAELRRLLERAHREGQLDTDAYTAAKTELTIADDCIAEDTASSRSALLVTLKRLRGLVADVAELATAVAAIIAAARGLS
ncbi:5'-methylthioadenosine/S-adenosylhomocysteine nucleosidase [Dactylosporangium sp. NPDC051484]|uniref:5'-methylthioadenosine/S-adenosylhomocysteine nucleosidase family protein n=1 Tax=Dactylosporangium sp. NPDC051484 TaxID=3154942 RepID=UPI00344F2842